LLDTLRGILHAASVNGLADEDISAIIKQLG